MDVSHAYVLLVAAAATLLLAFDKAHLIVVGIGLVVAVAVPGLVPAADAVAGFGNPAVVTVGALYVVGEGFLRTGAASILAQRILARTGGREVTTALLVMLMAAALSAFVNNILVVVTFLPVITTICRQTGIQPSRLLIPLSYASIAGGLTTLVGTSTNLLVSGVLVDVGREPIGMFEMTPAGLILASAAILYMAFIGRRLLPRIPSLAAQPGADDLKEYVTEITIGTGSPLVGRTIDEVSAESDGRRTRVSMVVRGEVVLRPPFAKIAVAPGDTLMVRGHVQRLAEIRQASDTDGDGEHTERLRPGDMSFFELATTPQSSQIGRRVQDLRLRTMFGAAVVGVLRDGHHMQQRLSELRLRQGDVLLAFGDDDSKEKLRRSADWHLIEGIDQQIYRREKAPTAITIVGVLIAMFVSGVEPVTAALIGALSMVLTGCLSVRQAQSAVNWSLLTFIAGTLALSKALRATEADVLLGQALTDAFGGLGTLPLVAAIYFGTILLTELLSNNAVAVIMTPVALATAAASGLDERLAVMAVAFAASNSFANPIGYKTNLLVFGPGGYRFRDFFRVGIGLDLLMGTVGVLVLPSFFGD